MASRFGTENPDTFRDEMVCSKKTKQVTSFAVKILTDFLSIRGKESSLLELSKGDLANVLQDFYSNVRTKNGELYKKNSLLSIRQSINRYLKDNGKMFDIITDPEFTLANGNFTSILRKTKKEGKGNTKHHDALSVDVIQRLYKHPIVFNTSTPQGLVKKVIFEIILYFCRRGQENLHELTINNFRITKDENNIKYVEKCFSELTKNHQGVQNDEEGTGGKMYETGSELCPVKSFEKYVSKRNKATDRLFLHPKDSFNEQDIVWYRNEPMGSNTLKHFMKNISKTAALPTEYTNHCIRATCITLLDQFGFQGRHIKTISGHKSEDSLTSYCYDTTVNQKRSMSNVLSACTHGKKPAALGEAQSNDAPLPKSVEVVQSSVSTSASTTNNAILSNQSGPLLPWNNDFDILDLPDNVLVRYAQSMESSSVNTYAPSSAPNFNFSNCTVNFNYYGSSR